MTRGETEQEVERKRWHETRRAAGMIGRRDEIVKHPPPNWPTRVTTVAGELFLNRPLPATPDALVLAEEFVAGPELTAGFVGEQALPLIRIEAPEGRYDYQNKYFSDDTRYFCPCGLPAAEERAIQDVVMRSAQALECQDWGRADLIRRADGSIALLEMNTTPGMTGHSLVPMAAKVAGMDFQQLVLRILELAHVG